MTERENYIRAARFDNPEWIPVSIFACGGLFYCQSKNFVL